MNTLKDCAEIMLNDLGLKLVPEPYLGEGQPYMIKQALNAPLLRKIQLSTDTGAEWFSAHRMSDRTVLGVFESEGTQQIYLVKPLEEEDFTN